MRLRFFEIIALLGIVTVLAGCICETPDVAKPIRVKASEVPDSVRHHLQARTPTEVWARFDSLGYTYDDNFDAKETEPRYVIRSSHSGLFYGSMRYRPDVVRVTRDSLWITSGRKEPSGRMSYVEFLVCETFTTVEIVDSQTMVPQYKAHVRGTYSQFALGQSYLFLYYNSKFYKVPR